MKNTKLVAILLLQAVLVMGILSHANAEFPKCCNSCRFFSGAVVCDDAGPKCRDGCVNCRVVQATPPKTYRCADARVDDGTPCKPCKKH